MHGSMHGCAGMGGCAGMSGRGHTGDCAGTGNHTGIGGCGYTGGRQASRQSCSMGGGVKAVEEAIHQRRSLWPKKSTEIQPMFPLCHVYFNELKNGFACLSWL